ncbi:hypothetical protein [Faunimonas pinastri]|uniref:hypothetical protein n=1 Tax=Faunimonas pinastri TaxID=1855383 RepID=UPI001EEA1D18|nr:hypothetical protein [Faunimonas pinastri]
MKERARPVPRFAFDYLAARHEYVLAVAVVMINMRPLRAWIHVDNPNADAIPRP